MPQQVAPFDLGVTWEPNAPEAVMLADDSGRTALAMRAHFDDEDDRAVVLRWDGVAHARFGSPNDEAIRHHSLYDRGLSSLTWAGIVHDSVLVESMRAMWSRFTIGLNGEPSLRIMPVHYVVLTKECLVEVLAENVDVLRIAGQPNLAVSDALRP